METGALREARNGLPFVDMTWRNSLLGVLAAAWVASGTAAAQGRPVRSDQQILIQLERDWDVAFREKDLTFLENVPADEFVATYGDDSLGDKARELTLAKEFNKQVDSSTQDEFSVKVFGDTAIVWFRQTLVGPSKGKQLEVVYRYVDVFVWRAGRWQCVSSQSTRVAPA
jgi:ketosteroid isomerase-like protein